MAKPIKIVEFPVGFAVYVNDAPVVDTGTVIRIEAVGRAASLFDYARAESLAHEIGRYKLGLGDFIDTYVEGLYKCSTCADIEEGAY